jgi:hypothetical protein
MCRLPAETGALVMKALDLALEQLPPPGNLTVGVPAGTPDEDDGLPPEPPPRVPFAMRRADALAVVAESFVARGAIEAPGTDRHQIVVHVAAETLRDRVAGRCGIEHGPAVAAETARRFSCDASIVTLIENADGDPLNVGRKTRTISAPLRRLLNARDKGCRFPGCANSRYVDAHHIKHWANGGDTKPANLLSLCRFHHRAVHEGGINIEVLDDGALRFLNREGDAVTNVYTQPPGDWRQLPNGTASVYRGDHMDYALAVDVLLQQASRAVRASPS